MTTEAGTYVPALPSLLELQQARLRRHFEVTTTLTPATFAEEILLVARTAAAEGEYGPAAVLYKLLGTQIGAVREESNNHQHLHIHGRDLNQLPDDALMRLVSRANEVNADAVPVSA